MSDKDIERAVAPFWRCPDCGSVGTPYVAELDALRAELAELRRDHAEQVELVCKFAAERDRLRAALEAAPDPGYDDSVSYHDWYDTTRKEALDG